VPNGSQQNDAAVNIADCTGAFNQHWRAVRGWERTNTVAELIARHSGKCLGVLFETHEERAQVVQKTCGGGSARWLQKHAAEYTGLRRTQFVSNQCLDVSGRDNGASVQQYTCNGTVNQFWERVWTSGGYFKLRVASSGRCLQAPDAVPLDNSPAFIADCTGLFNQQWIMQPAGSGLLRGRQSGACLSILFEGGVDLAQTAMRRCDSVIFPSQNWSWS
jgi:hypothetical protein